MSDGPRVNSCFHLGVLGCVLLMLGACSYIPGVNRLTGEEGMFRDRQADYLEAETVPRTEIPEPYDSYMIDDLYVIPQYGNTQADAFLEVPRPRALEGRSDREVVIQRIGDRSWVVVDAAPSQVWPRIRDYWTTKGVNLAFENPTRGVMDTGWFILQGNQLSKEKFRVLVEPGFQNNSSEVRLLHVSQPQSVPSMDQVNWPETPDNQELTFEILRELSGYLADFADQYRASSVSFLAGSISSQGKAQIVSEGEEQLLRLQADYQRSWAAVLSALQRAEVEILSRDEEQGSFEVRYTLRREEEEKGFFRKLVTLDALRDDPEDQQYTLRIQLNESAAGVDVRVESVDSGQDTPVDNAAPAQDALLQTLKSNIA